MAYLPENSGEFIMKIFYSLLCSLLLIFISHINAEIVQSRSQWEGQGYLSVQDIPQILGGKLGKNPKKALLTIIRRCNNKVNAEEQIRVAIPYSYQNEYVQGIVTRVETFITLSAPDFTEFHLIFLLDSHLEEYNEYFIRNPHLAHTKREVLFNIFDLQKYGLPAISSRELSIFLQLKSFN